MPNRVKLLLALALATATSVRADTYYLSPAGRDDADGGRTLAEAFATFAFAVPHLRPGDTLIVDRGTYTPTDGGLLRVVCPRDAQAGMPDASITIRALEERQSILEARGAASAILIDACDYWNIAGLTAVASDNPGEASWGAAVRLWNLHHVVVDKLLVQGNNRYSSATAAVDIATSSFVTIQDSEVYDFTAAGLGFWNVSDCVVRRVYLNSRGRTSLDGGVPGNGDDDRLRGDVGVAVVGPRHLIENTISEGQTTGFAFYSWRPTMQNLVVGSISLDDQIGAHAYTEPQAAPIESTRFLDFLVVSPAVGGLRASGVSRTSVTRGSFIGGTYAVLANRPVPIDGGSSISVDSSLAVGQSGTAYTFLGQDDWTLSTSAAFQVARALDGQPAGQAIDLRTGDAGLAACPVTQSSRLLIGAALDGGDIGAQILFRSEDGARTQTPLWDPATSAFPCGAVVKGINDVPDASCRDVHVRLHVGTPDCPLPAVDGGVAPGQWRLGVGCGCQSLAPDALMPLLLFAACVARRRRPC